MFDLSFFIGKSYSDDDGSSNYLIFQSVLKHFKTFTGTIIKIFEENLKGFQKKVSQLLLHWVK